MTEQKNKIKYLDITEFREMGLLAEVNRQFFHPLGLALEVIKIEDGSWTLSGIWDYRDDPEGILYGEEEFPQDQCKKAKEFIAKQHKKRYETLGFVYQHEEEYNNSSISNKHSL